MVGCKASDRGTLMTRDQDTWKILIPNAIKSTASEWLKEFKID